MSGSKKPLRGTFVLPLGQTALDGEVPGGIASIDTHKTWSWTGVPVCLVRGGERVAPEDAPGRLAEAARLARRLLTRALEIEVGRASDGLTLCRDAHFTVTDGIRFWSVALVELDGMPRPIVLFAGEAPPPDRRLIVSEGARPLLAVERPEPRRGAVCFTPGTRIETETGPRLVETLAAEDRVLTRDNGPQPILWVGSRRITGARLHAMPDLRPVAIREGALGEGRPEGDLVVSPDHRVLLTGARAQAAWGEPEVLVAARDLIDDHGVTRAHDLREVTYIHLLLPSHQIVTANGVAAESFHPADADLDILPEPQRLRLLDLMPHAATDPETYGPHARTVLTSLEAAILTGVAQA